MKISNNNDMAMSPIQTGFSGRVWLYAKEVYTDFRFTAPSISIWTEYKRVDHED